VRQASKLSCLAFLMCQASNSIIVSHFCSRGSMAVGGDSSCSQVRLRVRDWKQSGFEVMTRDDAFSLHQIVGGSTSSTSSKILCFYIYCVSRLLITSVRRPSARIQSKHPLRLKKEEPFRQEVQRP
jgi:hypothetical protein